MHVYTYHSCTCDWHSNCYYCVCTLATLAECACTTTLQAIACAAAYEEDWPLLIISPSTARYHWAHELKHWLDEDTLNEDDVSSRACTGTVFAVALLQRFKYRLCVHKRPAQEAHTNNGTTLHVTMLSCS
jgi:hypothetical protein